jgi:hypothetical protein
MVAGIHRRDGWFNGITILQLHFASDEIILRLCFPMGNSNIPPIRGSLEETEISIAPQKTLAGPHSFNFDLSVMKHDPNLTRLLLLNLRDGGFEDEINRYPKELVLEQKKRLIDDRLATGAAIPDAGRLAWVKALRITSAGHRYLEAEQSGGEDQRSQMKNSGRKVFISHSSADADIADALVDLLCTALPLRRADFLCTSVDGCRLPGGALTSDTLRKELQSCPAFLSLLTRNSISSSYVLFELGARWGCGKHHIPLLAKGFAADLMKEPLKEMNALNLAKQPQVLQLVSDLAELLRCKAAVPNAYFAKVQKVAELAKAPQEDSKLHP